MEDEGYKNDQARQSSRWRHKHAMVYMYDISVAPPDLPILSLSRVYTC